MKPIIIYSGALAQHPRNGGLQWFHLQFVLGLRRLGYRVVFVDWLERDMCRDDIGKACLVTDSFNLKVFLKIMQTFEFDFDFCLLYDRGTQSIGMSVANVQEVADSAEALFNVMGYLRNERLLGRCKNRVFMDIDPGFAQMWHATGLYDSFAGHNTFVTIGQNIGSADCSIPTCGLTWMTTPQPVVMACWPFRPSSTESMFTSIGAWRGPNAPVEYAGQTYGLRVHEFRKFISLPRHCPQTRFKMAFDLDAADHADRNRMADAGWQLLKPDDVAGNMDDYRTFIAKSKAEFVIPKEMYVATRSGLLSDRSGYYLSSGRPVLTRDTGLGEHYPLGEGLLVFDSMESAVAGIDDINHNYVRHCSTAREIAREYLDSDRVLTRLLNHVL